MDFLDFFGAHKAPSYDTKRLLKVDKTAFVKYKISNNFKQKIDETNSKQKRIHRKIPNTLWILKISGKNSTNQLSVMRNPITKVVFPKDDRYQIKEVWLKSEPEATSFKSSKLNFSKIL